MSPSSPPCSPIELMLLSRHVTQSLCTMFPGHRAQDMRVAVEVYSILDLVRLPVNHVLLSLVYAHRLSVLGEKLSPISRYSQILVHCLSIANTQVDDYAYGARSWALVWNRFFVKSSSSAGLSTTAWQELNFKVMQLLNWHLLVQPEEWTSVFSAWSKKRNRHRLWFNSQNSLQSFNTLTSPTPSSSTSSLSSSIDITPLSLTGTSLKLESETDWDSDTEETDSDDFELPPTLSLTKKSSSLIKDGKTHLLAKPWNALPILPSGFQQTSPLP